MATYEKFFSSTDTVKVELQGDTQSDGTDYGSNFKDALFQLGREIGESMSALPEENKPSSFEIQLKIKATPTEGLVIVPDTSGGHFAVRIVWAKGQGIDLTGLLGP
jgi:hypothetical protein